MTLKKGKGDEDDKKKKVGKGKKLGRPKKRGRKKKSYKPKSKKSVSTKGFSKNITYNRVRHVLWLNHKDDFPNYREFISNKLDDKGNRIKGTSIVSQVFNQCKSLECNDDDILAIYGQFKEQDKDGLQPTLPDEYYDPEPYWNLITTQDYWEGMDDKLWVYCPMLIANPDYFLGILGSDRIVDSENQLVQGKFEESKGHRRIDGKSIRFKPFVDYCNELQLSGLNIGTEEQPHFRFVGKTDEDRSCYWNEENKRWEVRIIICDNVGNEEDYGYVPTSLEQIINPELISQIKQKTKEEKIDIPASKKEVSTTNDVELKKIEAELKLAEEKTKQRQTELKIEEEKTKQKQQDIEIQKANMKVVDLFINGKISEATMNKLLK